MPSELRLVKKLELAELTDEDVMERCALGSETAFRALVQRYRSRIMNLVCRFINDRDRAEEISQEVFLRVYRNRERYRKSGKFSTWIFTIAVNLTKNEIRSRVRHKGTFSLDAMEEDPGRHRAITDQSRPADAEGATQTAFESGGRMNCRSVESLFSSYVEDEISQEERRHLEAHLMGCRRCSIALREVRATLSILSQGMPVVEPSAHFDEDVFARIRSGEGLRPGVRELILELLSPLRLRPLYVAGAGDKDRGRPSCRRRFPGGSRAGPRRPERALVFARELGRGQCLPAGHGGTGFHRGRPG